VLQTVDTTRRRATGALFATAALMNAAMAAASPVSTIVAADRSGTAWGALPNTAGIVGTGVGALALTRLTDRWGWRRSLAAGYAAATAGAALAVPAVAGGHLALLCGAMFLLGLGNAGALLSRYAAAERYPADRRGTAIGIVVWAGAFGAVAGPLLLAPSSAAAGGLGAGAMAGPFLLAGLATAVAWAAASTLPGGRRQPDESRKPLRELARTPTARSALAVMATAQIVMVLVMTAAPLDMHLHHQRLGPVGAVLSAHTLGMFALSPLTGRLLDRVGSRPVILAGLATLAAATVLAATAAPHGRVLPQAVALFLLGYGWNLCFIGGSGRLASGLPAAQRAGVEGAVDAAVWGVAATGSLASSVVLAAGGYPLLVAAAGALVVFPTITLLNRR
jgi:MFS family permease